MNTGFSSGLNNNLLIAQQQLERGNIEYANEILVDLLKKNPENLDAHHLMSMVEYMKGNLEAAIQHCRTVLELAESGDMKVPVLNNLGNFLKAKGDLRPAKSAYQEVLKYDPRCFPALFNLGNVEAALGDSEKAVEAFGKAIKVDTSHADCYYNMGMELSRLGDFEAALDAFEKAIEVKPGHVEAITQLGTTYFKLDRLEEAVNSFARAAACDDADASVFNNYGVALTSYDRANLAVDMLAKAVQMAPEETSFRCNLGVAQSASGDQDGAILSFRTVLKTDPFHRDSLKNLAVALHRKGQTEESAMEFRKALDCDPYCYETHIELASCLYEQEKDDEALESVKKARQLNPESFVPLYASMIMRVRRFSESEEDFDSQYDLFLQDLSEIEKKLAENSSIDLEDAISAIGFGAPYCLSLQDRSLRQTQSRLAEIYEKIMSLRYPDLCRKGSELPLKLKKGEKIKLGIVSSFFFDHSVYATITKGFLACLPRDRFEVIAYSIGYAHRRDHLYESIKEQFDDFVEIVDFDGMVSKIEEDKPDVIFYPSIGIVPESYKFAALRLAPLQLAGWGYPITSGLSTIDGRFSPIALEPDQDGEVKERYVEKLLKLPGIGFYYEPDVLETDESNSSIFAEFEEYGLEEQARKFLCVQANHNYLPQHDKHLIEIAREVSDCQFVFPGIETPNKHKLEKRLTKAFEDSGLNPARHLVFLPRLSAQQYKELCEQSYLYLDTARNSGLLSTLEALDAGILPVAFSGSYLRSNLAAGLLKQIGLDELVASNSREYIDLAVSLSKDELKHQRLKSKLLKHLNRVYRDQEVLKELPGLIEAELKVLAGSV